MTDGGPGRTEDDGPVAPPIPSFASLRAPQRRSAIDLLLPPAAAEGPAEEEPPAPVAAPGPRPAPVAGPRPAEWADLWRFGTRAAHSLVGRLRSLLGG